MAVEDRCNHQNEDMIDASDATSDDNRDQKQQHATAATTTTTTTTTTTRTPSTKKHHQRIVDFFKEQNVTAYQTVQHEITRTSEESARVRNVPIQIGGKALLLKLGTKHTSASASTTGNNDTKTNNTTNNASSASSSSSFCYALFVMSAAKQLDSKKIMKELQLSKKHGGIRFASKEELAQVTQGLVPGAVPPFGAPILADTRPTTTTTTTTTNSADTTTPTTITDLYVDTSILENERIAFNAGSLTDSIIMSVHDYLRISNPTKIFTFSKGGEKGNK